MENSSVRLTLEIAVPVIATVCLEAKGIDSKQLVCPDTSSFIEQGKKELLDFRKTRAGRRIEVPQKQRLK